MLELFEQIHIVSEPLKDDEQNQLYLWLEKNSFPSCCLPEEYLSLMQESNGGDFISGAREYQFLSVAEAMDAYECYMFPKFMPFAFPFAMDGNGNFYIFNLRAADACVYLVNAGYLSWEQDAYCKIAESFAACIEPNKGQTQQAPYHP